MDRRFVEEPYPFQSHLGFNLTEWREGFARFEQPTLEHLGNRHGNLHGGVHATLLDTAMGYAGCWTGDPDRRQMALTLSLTVNYLGRSEGLRMIAEARLTGGGRRTFFAEGEVRDEDGVVLATGSGVFRYRDG
ncbi:MAG: PaaI family thioesterase [Rhodosalinus sp.]